MNGNKVDYELEELFGDGDELTCRLLGRHSRFVTKILPEKSAMMLN